MLEGPPAYAEGRLSTGLAGITSGFGPSSAILQPTMRGLIPIAIIKADIHTNPRSIKHPVIRHVEVELKLLIQERRERLPRPFQDQPRSLEWNSSSDE